MISKIPYNIAVRTGYGEETVEDSHIEFIATQRAEDGEHDSGYGSGGRKKVHGKRGSTFESRGRGVEVHPLVQIVRVVSGEH